MINNIPTFEMNRSEKGRYTVVTEDGRNLSRNEFIKELFTQDHSRKEIAEVLGCRYQIVYQATATLTNNAHNNGSTGRTIIVETEDGRKIPRAEYIRELFLEKDMPRGDIARKLNVQHQIVFQATKGLDNTDTLARKAKKAEKAEKGQKPAKTAKKAEKAEKTTK